jgi:hypothetical protein
MADQTNYPSPQFPTVFADGVSNIVNSKQVTKFFLTRFESDLASTNPSKSQPFMQVVTSMEGFAATFTFFEAAVERYVSQDLLTQQMINQFREAQKSINWKVS